MSNGFRTIEPKILYFGTPVALVSSKNEDGTTNLAPISSFWALGWTFMLGLLDETKTADNLARVPECVINIPSPEMWQKVEKLSAAHRQKSGAGAQNPPVPLRTGQVRRLRINSDAERTRTAGTGSGMPHTSGEPRRSSAHDEW